MTPIICYRCLERIRDLLPIDSVACLDSLRSYLAAALPREALEETRRIAWGSAHNPHGEGSAWLRGHSYLAASAVAYGISCVLNCRPGDARTALWDARGARARYICGDSSDSGWTLAAYMAEHNRERDAQVEVLRSANKAAA